MILYYSTLQEPGCLAITGSFFEEKYEDGLGQSSTAGRLLRPNGKSVLCMYENVYNEIDTHQKKFHNDLTMNGHSSLQEYIYGSQQAMRRSWFVQG